MSSRSPLASVAQSVEQGTENPRVGGSIPPGGTISPAGVAQLAEQLICNQQVAGSSPIASSILWVTEKFHMDGFPSGQREQTVNLPSPTSVVRIHPHPHSAGMAELADALDSGSSEG